MNIVQAYTKLKGQFIILVSGFSGSGKILMSKFIADLFNFQHIDSSRFFFPIETFNVEGNFVTLKDGTKVLDWDNIYKSIDWNELNNHINNNKQKENGIVLVGFGFPKELLTFEPDFHIHYKINKKKLIENREAFMEKHSVDFIDKNNKDNKDNKDDNIDDLRKVFDTNKTILNVITFPMYLKLIEESKIDKFVNTTDMTNDKIKEETFSYLMNSIEKWLNENDKVDSNKKTQKPMNEEVKKNVIPKVHYDGNAEYYDKFYFPNKRRILYDFNDEGNDYSVDYAKKFETISDSSSSSSDEIRRSNKSEKLPKQISSSDSSDSGDADYLFTTDGREFETSSETY